MRLNLTLPEERIAIRVVIFFLLVTVRISFFDLSAHCPLIADPDGGPLR